MGRSRGRRGYEARLEKAFSAGAAAALASANGSTTPRTQQLDTRRFGLGDALNLLTLGSTPMPRDPFDMVGFGPNHPLAPAPLDPSRPDTGRPEPRVNEYPVSWNIPGSAAQRMNWATLRAAAENVDIMRRCIEVRKEQIKGLKWSIGLNPDVVTEAYEVDGARGRMDIEAELRQKFLPEIRRCTAFWLKPWASNGVNFTQWVNAFIEDHVVLDANAVYPQYSYGGKLLGLELIDGTTIVPMIDHRGARPLPPYPAFQQSLYAFPRSEFVQAVKQNEDGTLEVVREGIPADQLFYYRDNFRTTSPYGFSAVEQALISARLYLKRQGWMLAEYDDGSTPLTWLVPEATPQVTDKMTAANRLQWERSFNDKFSGNTAARHRIKLAPPGMNPVQMASVDERYKPEYDLHLIKLLASFFGVTATGLGFSESKGLGNSGLHEGQENVQDKATTAPDRAMLEAVINELSYGPLKMPPELVFNFVDPDVEDTATEDATSDAQRKRGTITLNEDRRKLGLAPSTIPEADMLMVEGGPTGWMQLEGMAARAEEVHDAEKAALDAQTDASVVEGEEVAEEDVAKALELAALTRWRRKRGESATRPFVCKALEPDDFTAGVPVYVDFEAWVWVPDDADADEIIEKALGGGNDNWRHLLRDRKGRWMKTGTHGPALPGKAVLAGLAAQAQHDRARRAATEAASQLRANDAPSMMGGMPKTKTPKPAKSTAPKRLPEARHAALVGVAERYAHNVSTMDLNSQNPGVNALDVGMRPATADALVKSGHLERTLLNGFQRRYRLGEAGHAYLAEHTGDTERARLTAGIADLERQRAELNASRTPYDRDARNLAASLNAATRQAEDGQDRTLMAQANALRAERAKLPVIAPKPPAPRPLGSEADELANLAEVEGRLKAKHGAGWEDVELTGDELTGYSDAVNRVGMARRAATKPVTPQAEDAVHAAYLDAARTFGWREGEAANVSLVDLRGRMAAAGIDERADQDRAIRDMALRGEIDLFPEENQQSLRKPDRDAAIRLGNIDNHIISIEPHRQRAHAAKPSSIADNALAEDAVLRANEAARASRKGFARRDGASAAKASTTEHPQKAAFDKLLDGGMVKHKPTRQIVEQLEAHGWKLTQQDRMYGTTSWEAPDGRTLGIQHIDGDKPRVYAPGQGERMTYKAALAHVVTPTHEEVSGPNMRTAANRVSPGLGDRITDAVIGGTRDDSMRALVVASRQLSGYGSTPKRPSADVAADLRGQADRLDALAQSNAEHHASLSVGGTSSMATRQREQAVQMRQIADMLGTQTTERQAYEAERERRAAAPLNIRPTARGTAKPATPPAAEPASLPTPAAQPALSKKQRALAERFDKLAGEHATDPDVAQWRDLAINLTGELERGDGREADAVRSHMSQVQDAFTHAMKGAQAAAASRAAGGDERAQRIARSKATLDSRARKVQRDLAHLERQIKDYTGETRKILRKRINDTKAERQRYLDRIERVERDVDTKLIYDESGKLVDIRHEPPK